MWNLFLQFFFSLYFYDKFRQFAQDQLDIESTNSYIGTRQNRSSRKNSEDFTAEMAFVLTDDGESFVSDVVMSLFTNEPGKLSFRYFGISSKTIRN